MTPKLQKQIIKNSLGLLLCLTLLGFHACATLELALDPAETAKEYFRSGNWYYNNGQWAKAVEEYTISIKGYSMETDKYFASIGGPDNYRVYNNDYVKRLNYNKSRALYYRGLSLKQLGNYFCASLDFGYVVIILDEERINQNAIDLRAKAVRRKRETDALRKNTGQRASDCPPRIFK